MLNQLAQGWRLVALNKRTILLLSLYQLFWTVLLYLLIERIVSPIVRALPSYGVSAQAAQYYWLEARFLAAKTELMLPYIYLFAALLLLRMIISPFIQSGLFGTLAKSRQEQTHNQFFSELKINWKPFMLLYWIKAICIGIPLFIALIPIAKQLVANYFALPVNELALLPLLLLLTWISLISVLVYVLLIGLVSQLTWKKALATLFTQALKLIAVTLIIVAILFVGHAIFQLSTLFIAGLTSTIVFFILPIIRTLLKVWTVSTHIIQFEQ